LKARIIPEIYWQKSFRGPDGKYDGKKFEDLASNILNRLHGDGWKPTPSSHDGSRDFEKRDSRGQLWAECKAYSDNLPIYVLSPTLVMALIEDPHTVIILSRSPLNDNAVRRLGAYQAITSKKIVTYDGLVLDDAILGTNFYEAYFPGLPRPVLRHPQLQVQWSLTSDALMDASDVDFHQYSTKKPSKLIDTVRYGLVRLDISLKNLSSQSGGTITLRLLEETIDPGLRIVAFNRKPRATLASVRIPPAGLIYVPVIVQALEASSQLPFPKVHILGPGAPKDPIEVGTLHVSQLYQINVVGAIHRSVLAKIERFLYGRRRSVVIAIEGASGTGKSRILQEAIRIGLEQGFRCHFYDPEFEDPKAADHVVRRLIADLSELPIISEDMKTTYTESTSQSAPKSTLGRILYDETFPLWDHIDDLVATIALLLEKTKTLLIIDNLQFTNDNFIRLIESLLNRLQHASDKRVGIIMAFNTDFDRVGSRSSVLLAKLRALSAGQSTLSRVFHARLEDFTIDDVAEFLQTIFSGTQGSNNARLYRKTLELFTEYVQPRPLNLWQSLMYLCDEQILSLDGDRLKVGKNESLLERLVTIPRKLQDLLALRWSRIQQNESRFGLSVEELDATARALYFLGPEQVTRILELGGSERAIERLLQAGIFASTPGERIHFFHGQVFAFFRTIYRAIDKPTAIALKRSFTSHRLASAKFQQYLIVCHFAGSVDKELITATVRHFEQMGLTADYWLQYTDILWNYLSAPSRTLSSTSIMGAALISQWQERMQSLQRGAASIQQFLAAQVLKNSRKRIPGEQLFYFYTAAANACLAIYDDQNALSVITIALNDLKDSHFSSNKERANALAIILNRQTAALKNFGRTEDALKAGNLALQKFRKTANKNMEVETLFDIASVLLPFPERRAEGWQHIRDGCEVFTRYRNEMKQTAVSRYHFVNAELALHDGRFADVYQFCADGVRHTERTQSHFWGIRIILLEVAARLLASSDSRAELETANALLIKARDWANVAQADRARWGLDYLDGKLLARTNNKTAAGKSFSEAITGLAGRLRTPEQVVWRNSLFRDIAATCRRSGIALNHAVISLLASMSVQSEMKDILQMSDDVFPTFDKLRISNALFRHHDEVVELV
jgi:hypothetical protein